MRVSSSWVLIRSRTARSMRASPIRNWSSSSSPAARTRRFPRWSMSSTCPSPRFALRTIPHDLDDVLPAEDALLQGDLHAQLLVHLQPADLGEVVATRVEEDVLQQGLGALQRGGIARAHAPVDLHQRLVRAAGVVLQQGLADLEHLAVVRPGQDLEGLHAPLLELLQQSPVISCPHSASTSPVSGLDHVPGQEAAHDVVPGDRNLLELQGLTPLQPAPRDALARRQARSPSRRPPPGRRGTPVTPGELRSRSRSRLASVNVSRP